MPETAKDNYVNPVTVDNMSIPLTNLGSHVTNPTNEQIDSSKPVKDNMKPHVKTNKSKVDRRHKGTGETNRRIPNAPHRHTHLA
jgi:hypothetical protein